MAMVAPQVGVGSQVGAAQPQPSPAAADSPATNGGPPPTAAAASAASVSPPSSDLPQGADEQRMRPEDFPGAAAREEEDARRRAARGGVELLSVRFNQDSSCFAVGTSVGFRLFSCEPMRETIRRDFNRGGVGFVEMLFRCNFMAVVGGGPNPQYPPNKVMIWDDNQSRCIGELMFRSEVRAVRLRRDRVVVVGEHKVYVYNFADLKLVHQIETAANPRGLCAVSQAQGNMVLACPGIHASHVRLELFDMNRTHFVAAHDSPVACMALTLDGTRLATASERGTLVRIFNTADGTQLQEVRRGKDRADIYSIAFAPRTPHLAVSSSRGTIHVFALNAAAAATHADRDGAAAAAAAEAAAAGGSSNPASSLGLLKGVLPKYFSSEWSMAQFHLPHDDALAQSYAAFGAEAAIVNVVCTNGTFYRLRFDPSNKGDMRMEEVVRFLEGRESQ